MPQHHNKNDTLSNSQSLLQAELNRIYQELVLQGRPPRTISEERCPSNLLGNVSGSPQGGLCPTTSPTSRQTRRRDLVKILNEAEALLSDDILDMFGGQDGMDSPNGSLFFVTTGLCLHRSLYKNQKPDHNRSIELLCIHVSKHEHICVIRHACCCLPYGLVFI
jgi:hypothetical protein